MLFLTPTQSSDYTTGQESCLFFLFVLRTVHASSVMPTLLVSLISTLTYPKLLEECDILNKRSFHGRCALCPLKPLLPVDWKKSFNHAYNYQHKVFSILFNWVEKTTYFRLACISTWNVNSNEIWFFVVAVVGGGVFLFFFFLHFFLLTWKGLQIYFWGGCMTHRGHRGRPGYIFQGKSILTGWQHASPRHTTWRQRHGNKNGTSW